MPLFRSNNSTSNSPPPQAQVQSPAVDRSPNRSRSIFSRRRSPSPEPFVDRNSPSPTRSSHGGFFSRRRSTSSDGAMSGSGGSNYRKGSQSNDPTIAAARQKVSDAESFEREADHALNQARAAVREARDHVRILEREAVEEYVVVYSPYLLRCLTRSHSARRAKMKQAEVKYVSRSARGLGRHG